MRRPVGPIISALQLALSGVLDQTVPPERGLGIPRLTGLAKLTGLTALLQKLLHHARIREFLKKTRQNPSAVRFLSAGEQTERKPFAFFQRSAYICGEGAVRQASAQRTLRRFTPNQ